MRPPEAWRDQAAEAQALIAWTDLLGDVLHLEAMQGARVLARSGRAFFPTAGELLQSAHPVHAISGDEAWAALTPLIRKHGSYHPPTHPDRELERDGWRLAPDPEEERRLWAALDTVGGWSGRCALLTDDVAPARAAFRTAYETSVKRARSIGAIDAVARIEARGNLTMSMDDDKVVQFPRVRG